MTGVRRSLFVVPNTTVLTRGFRVVTALLERLVRPGARPPVGHPFDLSFGGVLHDLLAERIAFLPYDRRQRLTLQVRMRREDAIRGVGTEHIEVAVPESS